MLSGDICKCDLQDSMEKRIRHIAHNVTIIIVNFLHHNVSHWLQVMVNSI